MFNTERGGPGPFQVTVQEFACGCRRIVNLSRYPAFTHKDSNTRRPEFEKRTFTIKLEIVIWFAIRQFSDHSYLLIFVVLFQISHVLI
jgi:hypothetical protein